VNGTDDFSFSFGGLRRGSPPGDGGGPSPEGEGAGFLRSFPSTDVPLSEVCSFSHRRLTRCRLEANRIHAFFSTQEPVLKVLFLSNFIPSVPGFCSLSLRPPLLAGSDARGALLQAWPVEQLGPWYSW